MLPSVLTQSRRKEPKLGKRATKKLLARHFNEICQKIKTRLWRPLQSEAQHAACCEETLTRCWLTAGPSSETLAQHCANIRASVACLFCEHWGLLRMRSFIHRRRCHGDNVRGDSMARSCCEIRCCFYSAHLRSCFHNAKGRNFWRKRNRSLLFIRDTIFVCFLSLNPYNALPGSFEYLFYGSPANRNVFFSFSSGIVCILQNQILTYKDGPCAEKDNPTWKRHFLCLMQ